MNKLKVGTRLALAFLLFVGVTSGVGWIGVSRTAAVNGVTTEIVEQRWPKVDIGVEALGVISAENLALSRALIDESPADIARDLAVLDSSHAKIDGLVRQRDEVTKHQQAREILTKLEQVQQEYEGEYAQFRRRMADGDLAGARRLAQEQLLGTRERVDDDWLALIQFEEDQMRQMKDEAHSVYESARSTIITLVLAAVLFAIAVAMWVTRSITGPLAKAVAATNRVAGGDLRASVEVTSGDEFGVLQAALRSMVEKLATVIGEVRAGSEALNAAAAQVSATSQSLSQGTSEQAASVEETTSSLEEMSASITQNAESARQTEAMATKGAHDAEESGKAVSGTVTAMNEIAEKIGIIQEIAYQTNLLALNAAIEAARAGDHGKGFAVVAQEVRKLAERAQKAAKEIGEQAGSSVRIADASGKLLAELVPAIRKTADLVQEVASASQEQSSGVNQIGKAMSQVDEVTQRNASAAEELASTAEEMSGQAESLRQLMSFFQVGDVHEGAEHLSHFTPRSHQPLPPEPAAAPAPAPHVLASLPHPATKKRSSANGAQGHVGEFRRF